MVALAGVFADILVTSPPSVNLPSNFLLTDSGDHKTFTTPTGSPQYRIWDRSATLTVQTSPDGTTWNAATPTTITFLGGKVFFTTAVTGATPGCRVTVGKYFPFASIGNTTDWQAQLTAKSVDVTTHKGVGGTPWEDYLLTTLSGVFTLKKWWIDETYINAVIARTLLVLGCVAPDGHRYDAYGYFPDEAVKLAVAGAVEEDLTFKADNVVQYN